MLISPSGVVAGQDVPGFSRRFIYSAKAQSWNAMRWLEFVSVWTYILGCNTGWAIPIGEDAERPQTRPSGRNPGGDRQGRTRGQPFRPSSPDKAAGGLMKPTSSRLMEASPECGQSHTTESYRHYLLRDETPPPPTGYIAPQSTSPLRSCRLRSLPGHPFISK